MSVATALALKLKFPEFVSLDDIAVGFALEEAYLIVNQSTTVKARDICALYLAAHFLAVTSSTADSDGREVTSETIGRISVSYKATSNDPNAPQVGDLRTTSYGGRYLQLKNLGNPRFKMVGGDTQRRPGWAWWN